MKIAITATEYPNLSLPEIFEKAKEFRVNYIEIVIPKNMTPSNLSQVKELIKEHKIQICCLTPQVELNLPDIDIKQNQTLLIEGIHMAAELGVKLVCTYFGGNPDRSKDEAIQEYIKNIKPCLKEAENAKVTLVLENEYDYAGPDVTRTAEGCLEIIKRIGSDYFKLNFDSGNFYIAGIEAYPYAYELLKEHIRYIHVKNAVRYSELLHGQVENLQKDITSGGIYRCVPLGKGAINYEAFLERLKEDNYQDFLTVEPHTPAEELDDTFRKGILYLREKGIEDFR